MKKIILISFLFSVSFFIDSTPYRKTKTIVADQLKLSVWKESGKFILYGKTKQQKWVQLLSEKKTPSNYFYITQNGQSIGYGEPGNKAAHQNSKIEGDRIIYFWDKGEIKIKTEYYFERSHPGHSYDTLCIDLTIYNLSPKDLILTLLVCFDENNLAPGEHYFLPTKPIATEQELDSLHLPEWILLKTAYPLMNLKLSLKKDAAKSRLPSHSLPDRIFTANWRKVKDRKTEYKIVRGRPFADSPYVENDSALFFEYQNIKIPVANTQTYHYSLQLDPTEIIVPEENIDQLELDSLLELLNSLNQKLSSGEIVNEDYLKKIDKRIEILRKQSSHSNTF